MNILNMMVHSLPSPCLVNSATQLTYDLQPFICRSADLHYLCICTSNFASCIKFWAMKWNVWVCVSSLARRRNIFTEKVLRNFIKTWKEHNLMALCHIWVNVFLCILSMDLIKYFRTFQSLTCYFILCYQYFEELKANCILW